jgi:hypothetical protein
MWRNESVRKRSFALTLHFIVKKKRQTLLEQSKMNCYILWYNSFCVENKLHP